MVFSKLSTICSEIVEKMENIESAKVEKLEGC